MTLNGKIAVITGASRGIGRGIALAFAKAGADVACIATSEANAKGIAEEIAGLGRRSLPLGCRVEDVAQVRSTFERIRGDLGPVDILVNNAGIANPKPSLEFSEEEWDAQIGINMKSVLFCSQCAARQMIDSNRGGSIINIGSGWGLVASAGRIGYSASKAAVHHMSRVLAIEWAKHGIRTNTLAPGYTQTEMVEEYVEKGVLKTDRIFLRTPQGRFGTVEEVADSAVYLASDAARYVNGTTLTVDGGFSINGDIL